MAFVLFLPTSRTNLEPTARDSTVREHKSGTLETLDVMPENRAQMQGSHQRPGLPLASWLWVDTRTKVISIFFCSVIAHPTTFVLVL